MPAVGQRPDCDRNAVFPKKPFTPWPVVTVPLVRFARFGTKVGDSARSRLPSPGGEFRGACSVREMQPVGLEDHRGPEQQDDDAAEKLQNAAMPLLQLATRKGDDKRRQ